jgi:hypothetical protein
MNNHNKSIYICGSTGRVGSDVVTCRAFVVDTDFTVTSVADLRAAVDQGAVVVGFVNVSSLGISDVYASYQQAVDLADRGKL